MVIKLPIVACYCGIDRVIFPINLIDESGAIVLQEFLQIAIFTIFHDDDSVAFNEKSTTFINKRIDSKRNEILTWLHILCYNSKQVDHIQMFAQLTHNFKFFNESSNGLQNKEISLKQNISHALFEGFFARSIFVHEKFEMIYI